MEVCSRIMQRLCTPLGALNGIGVMESFVDELGYLERLKEASVETRNNLGDVAESLRVL